VKLVTFVEGQGPPKVGAVQDSLEALVDLSSLFPSMLALIDGGDEALQAARAQVDRAERLVSCADVSLKAPVPVPRQIRDCMGFEKHLRQATDQVIRQRAGVFAPLARLFLGRIPQVWYDQPLYYKANRFSVIGPEAPIQWPSYSEQLDFECEVGVIIGRRGRDIPVDQAHEYIFGYLIFNDMSARDAQLREMAGRLGPAKGKDFDTGNVLGPWLVTADEIEDPYVLTMMSRVNGEQWGVGTTGDMHHRFEDMIAHISNCETLMPGELIGSGTVGDGCGLEHGRSLKPGDEIELEVSGLGVLRNRVVKP